MLFNNYHQATFQIPLNTTAIIESNDTISRLYHHSEICMRNKRNLDSYLPFSLMNKCADLTQQLSSIHSIRGDDYTFMCKKQKHLSGFKTYS